MRKILRIQLRLRDRAARNGFYSSFFDEHYNIVRVRERIDTLPEQAEDIHPGIILREARRLRKIVSVQL